MRACDKHHPAPFSGQLPRPGERFGGVQPEVLGVAAEEAAGIDRRRYDLELLGFERLEVPAGDACVAFCVFERQATCFTRAGQEVHLTPHEYKLLEVLLHHADRVVTHRQLLREVWGPGHGNETRSLRVYMASLRQKLEPVPGRPRWLTTETGIGYRLRLDPDLTPS